MFDPETPPQCLPAIDAIRQLMTPPEPPREEIGFHIKEEDGVPYRTKRRRRAMLSQSLEARHKLLFGKQFQSKL
jgi:hypothetical protein